MHRSYGRMPSRLPTQPTPTLTALFLTLGLLLTTAVGGHVMLTAVAAAAALTALAAAVRSAAAPGPVRVQSRSAVGHVDASTAYWCALPVPVRPHRPRAPGRG